MITAFQNARIFTGEQELQQQTLLIREDRVLDIVAPSAVPSDARIIDAAGKLLAPGFIDLQIYGGGKYLFSNEPSARALQGISEAIVKSGTTTYMITLATAPMELYGESFDIVNANPHPALAGVHLEGPYFNPLKRGAHAEHLIHSPDVEEVKSLLKASKGALKIMTLAPEVCSDEVLQLLIEGGVILSAGHSNATYAQAMHGFDRGIRTSTHLFNAMSALHHRDTGLPGAVFLSDAYASIIADGIHVDWQTLRISKQQLGRRLFLITDAVVESLSGTHVHVAAGDRYTLPDGTLSGSMLTQLDAVKNCVKHAGIELAEALRMATLYPAEVMQADDLGRIAAGAKANLILLDGSLQLQSVWLEGKEVLS